jgi:Flp pilus assembly pilin Flp
MKLRHEKGQGVIEYSLILVLVVVALIAIFQLVAPLAVDFWAPIPATTVIVILAISAVAVIFCYVNLDVSYPSDPKKEKAAKSKPGEKGQGLTEYALMLVLVAITVIAILMLMEPLGQVLSVFVATLSLETILIFLNLLVITVLIVVAWKRHRSNRN